MRFDPVGKGGKRQTFLKLQALGLRAYFQVTHMRKMAARHTAEENPTVETKDGILGTIFQEAHA